MIPKCFLIVASSCLLAATTSTLAQDSSVDQSSPDSGDQAPAQIHPQIQAALINLTVEYNALNSMLHSIGSIRIHAEDRINAMNAYMKQKNLTEGWLSYSASVTSAPAGTSFNQGYQTALANEKVRGTPQVSTQDLDALTRDVSATTTLAQESWNSQNKLFQKVSLLSAYLQSKNELVGYQQWAPNYAAQQRAAQTARYAAANKAGEQQADAYYHHLDELEEQWDKQPPSTGIDYNYVFSQGYGPAQGGTASQANTGGVGVNAPNVQGVNTPWNYAGAQGGFYPGAYGGGSGYYGGVPAGNQYDINANQGYNGGSSYNSYSDNYPDLYGYPAGTDLSVRGFGPNGVNNAWNRGNGQGPGRNPNRIGGPAGAGHAGGAAGVGQIGPAGGAGQVGGPGGAGKVNGPGGVDARK